MPKPKSVRRAPQLKARNIHAWSDNYTKYKDFVDQAELYIDARPHTLYLDIASYVVLLTKVRVT